MDKSRQFYMLQELTSFACTYRNKDACGRQHFSPDTLQLHKHVVLQTSF